MAGGATTTNLDDLFFAALFEARILQELRPAMTSRDFIRWGPKGKSTAYSFSIQDDPGPTTAALTQGTDFSTVTDLTTSKATATAAEVGIMTTVSDVLIEVSILDALSQVKGVLNRSTLEKWETDVAAKFGAGLYTTSTTAASTLTPDDFLRAVSGIEQRDAATGPLIAYVHPKQSGELRAEVAATTAIVTAAEGGVPMRPVTGGSDGGESQQGHWGSLFGVNVYQTSLVASSGGLRQGSISVSGQTMGAYELWSPRIETERRATLRGYFVMSSACYGLATVEAVNRGQNLKSAA